ncbi:MAG: YqgE/AlgH family protein [Pedosphaera sp.]|nr:YqgE/AlgH family protein [Pedosphaera sp.]
MPVAHSKNPRTLKGHLLLDAGGLAGSFFHKSVVLVCSHTTEGAFGLVLTRSIGSKIGGALSEMLPERLDEEFVYAGGPVQPGALSYLYSHPRLTKGTVLSRVSLGHELGGLIDLGLHPFPEMRLRIFAGYAGWSPGQLDEEIRRESWLIRKSTPDLIFHQPPETLWSYLLRKSPLWTERLLAERPDNSSVN